MALANILGHMEWALYLQNKERGIIICIIFGYPYRFIVFELSQIKFVLIKTQEDEPELFLQFNGFSKFSRDFELLLKIFKKMPKNFNIIF